MEDLELTVYHAVEHEQSWELRTAAMTLISGMTMQEIIDRCQQVANRARVGVDLVFHPRERAPYAQHFEPETEHVDLINERVTPLKFVMDLLGWASLLILLYVIWLALCALES